MYVCVFIFDISIYIYIQIMKRDAGQKYNVRILHTLKNTKKIF